MIPVNAVGSTDSEVVAELRDAFERVIGSGRFVLGVEVSEFEREWASAAGCPHSVGVASGMDAIELGLRAAGIGPGDEVIAPALTAAATILGIIRAGATPVLADVEPSTALIDPGSAERLLSQRTAAVLVVHLYGRLADVERWSDWTRRRGLLLVEDAAQAHLARRGSLTPGRMSGFAAYSFYPTKNLGAIGDAGAVVTTDEAIAGRVRRLRDYGQSARYHHEEYGVNARLDELQAAFLRVKLRRLGVETEARRRSVEDVRRGVSNPNVEFMDEPGCRESHVHHLNVVRADDREGLRSHLALRGVSSDVHYPRGLHEQPAFASLRRDPCGLPAVERHTASCLTIPAGHHLGSSEVARIVTALNQHGDGRAGERSVRPNQ